MIAALAGGPSRRWFAPEVVQTSSMDCGPAALKCLLEGFGIPVSYGRLREACQTNVDGTSIDAIERVANELGIAAEQVMLPADHLFLDKATVLPALVVVRHSSGPTHFVVVWRRLGSWLQVMDPAVGRRWVSIKRFADEIFRHEVGVAAADWRDWAATAEFTAPLTERLARLGADTAAIDALVATALADPIWYSAGVLDASIRLVAAVQAAGGVAPGDEAMRLVTQLFRTTCDAPDDIYAIIPPDYWSVAHDPLSAELRQRRVLLRGAVLVRVGGRADRTVAGGADIAPAAPLSTELAAALSETAANPLAALWALFAADGLLAPAALIAAMLLGVGATLVEALLFRGLFDIGAMLNLGSQRLVAVLGLLTFMALLMTVQVPIASESMRLGRRLDARLRMALLTKLPKLTDRYFHSRPISDMAERSHSIHLTRMVPGMGIHFLQSACELALTLAFIAVIDGVSALFAALVAGAALVIPALFQPLINESDLRVRSHSGALNGFYLDALLGLVPIRAHRAQAAVRHRHEGLLVEWARSLRRLVRSSLLADGLQQVVCLGLASLTLVEHFLRSRGVGGADLLLVYWVLKLPAIGGALSTLAHQYPAQRSVLLRLLEPLAAPEQPTAAPDPRPNLPRRRPIHTAAATIAIEDGSVVAGGHGILSGINLSIGAGEHVAVVGLSGAGKSSLIGLLLGWHQLASGRLIVDGEALAGDKLDALRRQTAWVDPAIQIWNKSFLDNLVYASPEPDVGRTLAALDGADLRGVLQKLPNGLQTALGEGGSMLSGGEGQRLRLGRALAQTDVRLALLDEPFRGMDRGQRSRLLGEARQHWAAATLICITHDVGETQSFDRVLVVEGGAIIEDGNPARLKARPSRYRYLVEAEQAVRDGLWQGEHWRHLKIEAGACR